jgi:hypothetical protein
MNDRVEVATREPVDEGASERKLEQLLAMPIEVSRASHSDTSIDGLRVGTLVALRDTHEALVVYKGQPGTAAIAARTTIDLGGAHVGREVALMFEEGDLRRPIVIGVVRRRETWPSMARPAEVEVDADGQRLVVSAKTQIVLRCGRASVTLTAAGKVLIQGAYVSHRSSGVMRIKGGSVQIN